jgi:hypothetical protein
VRLNFSETGGRNMVKESAADSTEEEEAKAMRKFSCEIGSWYHVKMGGTAYPLRFPVMC